MSKIKTTRAALEGDDILQAVVIADSFDTKFHPLTLDTPKALLPFLNNNFIEYALEALAYAGIHEAFVFSCHWSSQVVKYLENSKWMNDKCRMKVHLIISDNCNTLGEALQDISEKDLVRTDFVLLTVDTIFNASLVPIIKTHRERKQQDKNATLTLVLKEAETDHPLQMEDGRYFVMNEQNNRILRCRRMNKLSRDYIEYADVNTAVSVMRFNLLNCQISICSPFVLDLMVDNFDLESVDALVEKILDDDQVSGGGIYYHLLKKNEYAARVLSFQSYGIVALDAINRWTYPLVPDNNILGDGCVFQKPNVYLPEMFKNINRSRFKKNVVIGEDTVVGKNTTISNSVVGKSCKIGDDVTIFGCYIFDNVVIEDGCKLSSCFISHFANIGKNTTVPNGCVIGSNVRTSSADNLTCNMRLVSSSVDGSLDALPSKGGYVYILKDDDKRDDDDWGDIKGSDLSSESDVDEDVEPSKRCYDELVENLMEYLSENVSLDIDVLELNSVKHSFGIQISELKILLTKALLDLPIILNSSTTSNPGYFPKFTDLMKRFLPLLQNYIDSQESEKDVLITMEEMSATKPEILKAFVNVCKFLYDRDVLSEDAILSWWNDNSIEHNPALEEKMKPFINWLETAEEDSSEDSD